MTLEQLLDFLRSKGWMVGVHNDYVINNELHTFWLFTHPETGRFLKGEGKSDLEAVNQVRLKMLETDPGPLGGSNSVANLDAVGEG